jgi:hypothetical protein
MGPNPPELADVNRIVNNLCYKNQTLRQELSELTLRYRDKSNLVREWSEECDDQRQQAQEKQRELLEFHKDLQAELEQKHKKARRDMRDEHKRQTQDLVNTLEEEREEKTVLQHKYDTICALAAQQSQELRRLKRLAKGGASGDARAPAPQPLASPRSDSASEALDEREMGPSPEKSPSPDPVPAPDGPTETTDPLAHTNAKLFDPVMLPSLRSGVLASSSSESSEDENASHHRASPRRASSAASSRGSVREASPGTERVTLTEARSAGERATASTSDGGE